MPEVNFCSTCQFAKEEITTKGILLFCTKRKAPENIKQQQFVAGMTPYRKLNAIACKN